MEKMKYSVPQVKIYQMQTNNTILAGSGVINYDSATPDNLNRAAEGKSNSFYEWDDDEVY